MSSTSLALLFRAVDLSLDRRKLGVALGGTLVALLLLGLPVALGSLARNSVVTAIGVLVGLLLGWLAWSATVGAIAHLGERDLAGQPVGVRAAVSFGLDHAGALLLSPLLLNLLVLALFGAEALALWPARGAGVLAATWGALLFLPLTLLNMAALVVVGVGGWLIPAVVATEGTGPLATLRRVLAAVRQAPGQVVLYLVITSVLMLLFGVVIGSLAWAAALPLLAASGGGPLQGLLGSALLGLPGVGLPGASPLLGLGRLLAGPALALYGVALLVLMGLVAAVPYVIFPIVAGCAVYPGVRTAVPPAQATAQPPVTPPQPVPSLAAIPSTPQVGVQAPAPPVVAVAPAATSTPAPWPGPAVTQPPLAGGPPPFQVGLPTASGPPPTQACPQCGARLRSNARFCAQCGHKMS